MNVFFDLDGTLLDAKPRMYCLFQDLVPKSKLTFNEYWKLKKDNFKHKDILTSLYAYTEDDLIEFENEWMRTIEMPEWLALDKPFEGVTDYLRTIAGITNLYIVTARQDEENVTIQLSSFGWLELVAKVFVTNGEKEKHEMVKSEIEVAKVDWFVGDTGTDIESGKKLGIRTAAVLSGFMAKEKLEWYKPDLIVDTVLDLKLN